MLCQALGEDTKGGITVWTYMTLPIQPVVTGWMGRGGSANTRLRRGVLNADMYGAMSTAVPALQLEQKISYQVLATYFTHLIKTASAP